VSVAVLALAIATSTAGLAEQGSKRASVANHRSLGPIKQIDAGLLNVGYVEAGPPDGTAVILLHGWPYDIYSWCHGDHRRTPRPVAAAA